MEQLMELTDPEYVRKFQRLCGIIMKEKNTGSGSVRQTGNGALTQKSCCRYQQREDEHDATSRSSQKCQNNCEKNNNDVSKFDMGGVQAGYRNGYSSHHQHDDSTRDLVNGVWNKVLTSALGSGPPVDDRYVEYEIRYKSLYYLAKMGAFLGEEQFFLIFFPFVVWNLDSVLGRETIMVWFAVMYLGQASKDFLNVPRPPSPPVVCLEGKHLDESAMPSTHAMVGTAMPVVLTVLTCTRYQCSYLLVGSVAVLWCALVCLSRLYLGVHTILDVLCGFISSIVICAVMIPCLPNLDYYQQHHAFAPLVILIAGISLCTICYPTTEKHGAKAKAVEIVSVTTGICVGLWINYQLGFVTEPHEPMPYQITAPTLKWTALTLCRFVCGSAVLGVGYILVKTLSVRFFSMYFGLDKVDERHPSVRMAHKFVTYFVIGFMTTCGAPMFVFKALGIERISAFYECY
ncbi:sphingosine-1-phosphate phosphatase 2-like isoform X1 [Gigantopelta aegis]|uniref:sphingosine-1-phosphate phosphatase 2-like isoform X1 n=1 Tax=Gigantopelta aegis TaxID=1735272 RepID=UPI001B88B38E|nr:sphingosine-1-phosphate phosphatase 2-like isoform X1 [Gigantopelta aegis]